MTETPESPEFSREEKNKLRETFSLFDTSGFGAISVKELGIVMRQIGQNPSEAELQALMAEVDVNGTGKIYFKEFLVAIAKSNQENSIEEELKKAFSFFDLKGDGLISAVELKLVMRKLGEKMTDQEIDEIMKDLETDVHGHINFEEFKRLMAK